MPKKPNNLGFSFLADKYDSHKEAAIKVFNKEQKKTASNKREFSNNKSLNSTSLSPIVISDDETEVRAPKKSKLSFDEELALYQQATSTTKNNILSKQTNRDKRLKGIITDSKFFTLSLQRPNLQPWFNENHYTGSEAPLERLQSEIQQFIYYLSPNALEIQARNRLINSIEKVVVALWANASIEIFGSFNTLLFLPNSDIDIVVNLPEAQGIKVQAFLNTLLRTLNMNLLLRKAIVRENAKVPILNLIEEKTELEVDISINVRSGQESCQLISRFIEQCPVVRPLNMVIKYFLELKALNKVFTGGLSSYAITLLIVSFLQIHPLVRSGCINPMENLGILLIEFFELYGCLFNSDDVGITLTNGGRYYKRTLKNGRTPLRSTLELLDPQDETNNVTSGSFNYKSVQNAFKDAYMLLGIALDRCAQSSKPKGSLLKELVSIPVDDQLRRQRLNFALHSVSNSNP